MLALIGVGVFWLAGEVLPEIGLLAGMHWLVMIAVALCCGVLAWTGTYDTWPDRMAHFVALLLLCAAYATLWQDTTAMMTTGWQTALWLSAGVALPLLMSFGGPARDVFVDGDDD